MFKTVLKTIAVGLFALSANSVAAATVAPVTNAPTNNFASVQFDIGAAGIDGVSSGSFLGFVTDFDYTFVIPSGLTLVRATDLALPQDAGFRATTDGALVTDNGLLGQNSPGSVLFFAGAAMQPSTARLEGFISPNVGIDIMELLFSTTAPGLFTVSYRGSYTAFSAPDGSTTATFADNGSFDIRVAAPNASVIPLPAGGVLLLTAAGAFAVMRRRKA